MYDTLLFMHFFGLSIGAGTGIYLYALTIYATHNLDQSEARTLLPGIAGAISKVGNLGLLFLISSGVAMGVILGSDVLSPLFMLKMLLVFLIIIFVAVMNYLAMRVRQSPSGAATQIMKKLKILGPALGVATILAAVLVFH